MPERRAFLSRRVVTPEGVRPACVVVTDGRIVSVGETPPDIVPRDLGDLALLPGLVDPHVHVNEPGRTEWEGFATATRAAAAGGITTLVDMPLNSLPETTTVAALEAKRRAAAGRCSVDWAAWGGVAGDNRADLLPLARAGARGFKCFLIDPGCDGFTMTDEAQLRAALPEVAASGLPLLVHAELAGPIVVVAAGLAGADWRRYTTYLASRPDAAEREAIDLMIRLCEAFGVRIHIVHLSTAEALPALRAARARGLPITVETCPHYLRFDAEAIPDGATLFKCAPPIRGRANRDALWEALRDGTIDLVATDHSPCPPEMKGLDEGRFDRAWGGVASFSVALPALWTEARARGFGLADLARWTAAAPAALAGLEGVKGAIAPGYDADLVAFDPEATFRVAPETLHFRHPVSPYVGETLAGVVRETVVRGRTVFADGRFGEGPLGREVPA